MHPLQTKAWEKFRKEWGNEVVRVDGNLLTLHKVPFLGRKIGIFEKGEMPNERMISRLREFGEREGLIFIKIEPNYVVSKNNVSCADEKKVWAILRSYGARPGKTLFTPTTFWIDLRKSEDELFEGFSSKTRYNIRLAVRKGVFVREDNSDDAFEKYLQLMRETVSHQGFFAHSEKYHRLMWKTMRKAGIAHLLTAVYNGEIVTAWILFVLDDFLYYPYGARSEKHRNVMANNLMMWEAIKFGKRHKLHFFDLWGREEGKGFTKFKEGYNPDVVRFLGTWDLVIDWRMYKIYNLMEKVRWFFLRMRSSFVKPRF